jgi:uncharacterized membrane protein YgdD (TMEM256/DUF423 family)
MNVPVAVGALLASLGVAAGALGAHALKGSVDPVLYDTAVFYHLIHAVGMVAAGLAGRGRAQAAAAWLFGVGIVGFSGSLYVLSAAGPRWFGMAAPLGGASMIAGWLALALGAAVNHEKK